MSLVWFRWGVRRCGKGRGRSREWVWLRKFSLWLRWRGFEAAAADRLGRPWRGRLEAKALRLEFRGAETTGRRVGGCSGKEAGVGFSIVLGEALRRRESSECGNAAGSLSDAPGRVGPGTSDGTKSGPSPSPTRFCGGELKGNAKPASSRNSWSTTGRMGGLALCAGRVAWFGSCIPSRKSSKVPSKKLSAMAASLVHSRAKAQAMTGSWSWTGG